MKWFTIVQTTALAGLGALMMAISTAASEIERPPYLDVATKQGLNQAPESPAKPAPPGALEASVSEDGSILTLTWPAGQTSTIDVSRWNISILDALDCSTLTQVDQKRLTVRRIIGSPVVDPQTDNVAVPVLLEECVETQQTAVFIVDPQGIGAHALYRVQVPGPRSLPHEFSSYALDSISGLQYWDSTLLIRHGSASGAEALLIFRPDRTPAGRFVGCGLLNELEGAARLCPAGRSH